MGDGGMAALVVFAGHGRVGGGDQAFDIFGRGFGFQQRAAFDLCLGICLFARLGAAGGAIDAGVGFACGARRADWARGCGGRGSSGRGGGRGGQFGL